MPLIIICGLPSCGKTYRAKQLVSYFESRINGSDPSNEIGAATGTSSPGQVGSAVAELSALNLETAATENVLSQSVSTSATNVPGESAKSISNRLVRKLEPKSPPDGQSSSIRPLRVHHISDHSCHLPRSIYASGAARLEKDGRATLYSAVKRVLSTGDIVILDSGNYIKGWRYQLHCEAKNLATGSCVVQIGVPPEKCRQVNEQRLRHSRGERSPAREGGSLEVNLEEIQKKNTNEGDGESDPYDPAVFDELVMRFEEPNPMARWDSPLFAVPWDDPQPPGDAIWRELIENIGKDGRAKTVRPNQAAVAPPTSSSSHLYELDRTTQFVLSKIQEYQRDHSDEVGGELSISLINEQSSTILKPLSLTLPATPLSVPQLQRLRRQFISLHRQQMGGAGAGAIGKAGGGLSKERVGELFVAFLESQWGTG